MRKRTRTAVRVTTLRLSESCPLPLETVTETIAVLGRRGSGKTHTASVLAEEMLKVGAQVIIIDPLDVWKGLRTSADGKSDGFPVVVFGGDDGDLPLEGKEGVGLADAIIETGISAIISLRHLSKGAARRFVGDFCEQLYQRKGEAKYQAPLHLIVDEADAFVPQRPQPDGMKAYGALDTIVRRGRSSGFGTSLISQRAAVIAKDVLTQTEILICHQTTGPQDKKALQGWVDAHDDEGRGKEFLNSLAKLAVGQAWVWSPALLRLFKLINVRRRETFDSSSTPKAGEQRFTQRQTAKVDLTQLRQLLVEEEVDEGSTEAQLLRELETRLGGRLRAADSEIESLGEQLDTVTASRDEALALLRKMRTDSEELLDSMGILSRCDSSPRPGARLSVCTEPSGSVSSLSAKRSHRSAQER